MTTKREWKAKPAKHQLNINDTVRVKLTERGRHVYERHYRDRGQIPPTVGADGIVVSQFWVLMSIFAPSFKLGLSTPFEGSAIDVLE